MRTNEERIALVHRRAEALQKRRDRARVALSGVFSAVLFVSLTAAMINLIGLSPIDSVDRFTGASLLSESAGGYVLVAVVSFFAAVIITTFAIKRQKKK